MHCITCGEINARMNILTWDNYNLALTINTLLQTLLVFFIVKQFASARTGTCLGKDFACVSTTGERYICLRPPFTSGRYMGNFGPTRDRGCYPQLTHRLVLVSRLGARVEKQPCVAAFSPGRNPLQSFSRTSKRSLQDVAQHYLELAA